MYNAMTIRNQMKGNDMMKLREKPEVIIAWINGEAVQYKSYEKWGDFPKIDSQYHILLDDVWDDFRIKPKNIVKTTFIEQDGVGGFQTFSSLPEYAHNLRMTFSPEGKLLKAEAI